MIKRIDGFTYLLVFLVFISLIPIGCVQSNNIKSSLEEVGLVSNLKEYTLLSKKKSFLKEHPVIFLKGKNRENRVEAIYIKNITKLKFEKYAIRQKNIINSSYSPGISPYGGGVEKTYECDKSHAPRSLINKFEKNYQYFYSVPITKKGVIGFCASKGVTGFRAQFIVYCSELQALYDIKIDYILMKSQEGLEKVFTWTCK